RSLPRRVSLCWAPGLLAGRRGGLELVRNSLATDGDDPDALARAQCRLMARRLPNFAALWLPAAFVWSYVIHIETRVGVLGTLAAPLLHAAILLAAFAICRPDQGAPRVRLTILGACILLGVTTVGLFAAVGGVGDFCAFVLLTLYLLAALF